MSRLLCGAALAGLSLGASGCEKEELRVPTAEDVRGYYSYSGEFSTRMNGNVAEIIVVQPADQLRRGGPLWARVGPYIFLLGPETRDLFGDFNGLAGVRVITRDTRNREVARALLERATLNRITWRGAISLVATARTEGTRRPSKMEELVRYGEARTTFEYSTRYVPRN